MKLLLLASLLSCCLLACDGSGAGSGDGAAAPADAAVAASSHAVSCGCKLEAVGHCGNYIEVDGAWLEIANGKELGLGPMEWCKAEGPVTAEAAGAVQGGRFVASSLAVK